jgi:hypothetical protein
MKVPVVLLAISAAFVLCGTRAEAMVEQCPARASGLLPTAKAPTATILSYSLGALSQRTVDATIIADTNLGWFSWSVSGVPLGRVKRTDTAGTWPVPYEAWSSPSLSVAIPGDALITHAWVTAGKVSGGEATFNWDAKGPVTCDVPGFDAPPSPAPSLPAPAAVAAVPADAAIAKPTTAPFDVASCEKPFVAAAPKSGPPLNAALLGSANQGLAAEAAVIDVALDASGKVLDAWIEGSTHSAFDRLAMAGALNSTYTPAVSYCRPVEGIAKYTAWYQPTS